MEKPKRSLKRLPAAGVLAVGVSFLAFAAGDAALALIASLVGEEAIAGYAWVIGTRVAVAALLAIGFLAFYASYAARFSRGIDRLLGAFRGSGGGKSPEPELEFGEFAALRAIAAKLAEDRDEAISAERRAETAFEALIEAIPLVMAELDSAGRILRHNARFLEFAGLSPGSKARMAWDEAVPGATLSAIKASGGRPIACASPQGASRSFTWWTARAGDGLVVAGQDLTGYREMEDKLRSVDRMQSLGQLAGGIAHDFNNQICGIMGLAEVLLERTRDEGARRDIGAIISAAKRSADLTAKLLAFSRAGAQIMERTDLNGLAREAAALLSARGGGGRTELRLEARARTARGDPSQLRSAIFNLLMNAREAMGEKGTVVLRTSDEEMALGNQFSLRPGRYCAVSITDEGPGIAPDVLPRIFEPFFSTKEPGQSAGMGLAAVDGTAKGHGGCVEVRTEPGAGSVFTLHIPVLAEEGIAEALPPDGGAPYQASDAAGGRDLAGMRALIVDDERIVLETGTRVLESIGMNVAAFADPEEAMSWFSVNEESVSVVILDIVMPGMGGTGLFKRIRELSPKKPIIIVSGYSSDGEAEALLKEERTHFVQKPFERAAFIVAVRKAAGI